jgi:hypothetical protein
MPLREARRLAIAISTVICVHVGCNSTTAPTPLPPGYAGEWRGTTLQGTDVHFRVSGDNVTSLILTYNFSADCSGTLTNTNLAVPIRKQDPPGPPPFDQPGFAFGTNAVTSATAINGHFSPDQRSAAGEFVLVNYGVCGTVRSTWSATRR